MIKLADRLTAGSRKSYGMYEQALRAEREGRQLIHLELGRPVYDTPPHIKRATIRALEAGEVHYSDMQGLPALREALAQKLWNFNEFETEASSIIVTNGLTLASYAAFMALIDPGDEVILLEPYYPQHIGKVELAGGRIVTVPLDADNNFTIRADWVEESITPKTKMIVLVNPSNPTGRVFTREELQGLADVAIRHDLAVVTDEVYEYITFGDHTHVSIAALPGMRERTVSMYAFTKAYAMDGWRLGYLSAPPALIPGLLAITTTTVTHVNTFIQEGALAAVTGPPAAVEDMVADDRRKRDLVVERLNQIPGVSCPTPEGTIYAFPDIRGTGLSSQVLAERLLERAGVVVEAGAFYGSTGEGHLRICFGSQSSEDLEEAMARIAGELEGL